QNQSRPYVCRILRSGPPYQAPRFLPLDPSDPRLAGRGPDDDAGDDRKSFRAADRRRQTDPSLYPASGAPRLGIPKGGAPPPDPLRLLIPGLRHDRAPSAPLDHRTADGGARRTGYSCPALGKTQGRNSADDRSGIRAPGHLPGITLRLFHLKGLVPFG